MKVGERGTMTDRSRSNFDRSHRDAHRFAINAPQSVRAFQQIAHLNLCFFRLHPHDELAEQPFQVDLCQIVSITHFVADLPSGVAGLADADQVFTDRHPHPRFVFNISQWQFDCRSSRPGRNRQAAMRIDVQVEIHLHSRTAGKHHFLLYRKTLGQAHPDDFFTRRRCQHSRRLSRQALTINFHPGTLRIGQQTQRALAD